MKTVLKVDGMSCQHCVAAVTNAVSELEGVKGVEISLEEKTVAIEHDDGVRVDQLKAAIEDQGYDII